MPKYYHDLTQVKLQNAHLAIGVFDGVHRGHRQIIQQLSHSAHSQNAPAIVITFHPHPANVLTNKEIKLLTTPEERAEILFALGVDTVITQRFTSDLSNVTARDYMLSLKQHLGLSYLLAGYDTTLGKAREGNVPRLIEIGKELNYTVETIPALSDESGVISSTEIRKLISVGNVHKASKLLGYHYPLSGVVIHGAGRGKQINFPTANIDYPTSKAIPSNGIYACWATLGKEKFMAATSIGFNPTFTPERQSQSVEAYLLDFDRDIYGETLKLEFITRLRNEEKYTSIEALIEQIGKDVHQTREILIK
jgi:riboflavin kinase / FMN adenylyltransferase